MADLDKIRIGILGFGFMGQTHYNNVLKSSNAEIAAIFHTDQIKIPIPKTIPIYSDWRTMLDNSDIDAVVISTPTHTHAEIATIAAKKGKHIFLEKPMALSIKECDEIIKSAQDAKIKLFMGHVLRYWPSYSTVKCHSEMNPDAIGNLKMMRLQRLGALPSWSDWFLDVNKSGGVILDLSIHDIDFAIWTFNQMPHSVYCETKKIEIKGYSVPIISSTTLEFEKGIAYCEASWGCKNAYPFTMNAELIGDKGIIKFDNNSAIPLKIYSDSEKLSMDPYSQDGYYWELDSFIHSILENKPPAISGEDGKKAVAVCLSAIKSSEEQRQVNISEVLK